MQKFLASGDFNALMKKHAKEVLHLLIAKNQKFDILADVEQIEFKPALPKGLLPEKNAVLFGLEGYTLSSAYVSENGLHFHAAFGENDFESMVLIPLCAIMRISSGNAVFFVSFAMPEQPSETEKSKNIFKANPKNKDFFKK